MVPDHSPGLTTDPAITPHADIDRAAVRDAVMGVVGLCGPAFIARIAMLARPAGLAGRAAKQHHAIELTLARLLQRREELSEAAELSAIERQLARLAAALCRTADQLTPAGRQRLRAALQAGLTGTGSLVPIFHLVRTAMLQAARGFAVHHAGLAEAAPFDLLLARDGVEAELSCETVSAEEGRDLHRSAWFNLVDGIDPDLQTWLSAHPGRYLLKMTLPQGLRSSDGGRSAEEDGTATLAALQRRIRDMLSRQRRTDHDEAAVLRLDPLLLAGAQASELGLMDALRSQFGPEAQLAVTRSGKGVFVMAARAGRQNDIGAAVRRRIEDATPTRFSGSLPGILAIFLDDADQDEWQALRDGLLLEGETRQYLTRPDAARLVAVTAASRAELFGADGLDAAGSGDLRFRNQAHPAARSAALAPAITSSC